jgi:hypothetical protein
VKVTTVDNAFERLRQCVEGYMPESAFAARVNAELIRLGTIKNWLHVASAVHYP